MRILKGLRRSAPFSSLQRRIIFFNIIGLAVLVLGVLYLNQFRSGLIEQRTAALAVQAEIIAITIVEDAAGRAPGPGQPFLEAERANLILDRLARPTGTRARLYDSRLRLIGDTRHSAEDMEAVAAPLCDRTAADNPLARIETFYNHLADQAAEWPSGEVAAAEPYLTPEAWMAAQGAATSSVRLDREENLILSVALPIVRLDTILGFLVLSTEGTDINGIVRKERAMILQVFLVASLVAVLLSVLLANTIASPIRRLARAVDPEGASAARPLGLERIEVPDMTRRTDEIGDLSEALMRMTAALYRRIEAIESFAADVAHEIKNPLTSLRSAVETMAYARTEQQRQRLLDIIQSDVNRLDRLVTDISNASRLDAELVRERMEPFDLAGLVRCIAGSFAERAAHRDVTLRTVLPGGPLIARGLEERIAQVVTNLLDNALSFSPSGGTITVELSAPTTLLRLVVSDEGPGIPEENLATIFERFYSERPSEWFGQHSGLGLSICRQIVEAHGGRIWAENRRVNAAPDAPPEGARFTVELPK